MSLKDLIEVITKYLLKEKIDFGIIGAFALFSYGYVRTTRDVNIIARIQEKSKIISFLESLGFETTNSTSSFSNHVHSIGSTQIDFMYVDGKTADEIFSSVKYRFIFQDMQLPVVSAEHLIALKLFAIQNNPERNYKDLDDIRELLKHTEYDKNKVKEYFKKYGQESRYHELTGEKLTMLELKWDKAEEIFIKEQKRKTQECAKKTQVYDLSEYLELLSNFEPFPPNTIHRQPVDKQFTLD